MKVNRVFFDSSGESDAYMYINIHTCYRDTHADLLEGGRVDVQLSQKL